MAKQNEVFTFVIDRSNPHDKCVYYPKGHKDKPEGGSETVLEQLRRHKFAGRRDIALVNLSFKDGMTESYGCAYATTKGKIYWEPADCAKYFDKQEKAQLAQIAQRMLDVTKEFPEMKAYLTKI